MQSIILQSVDLDSHISTIEFYDGPPQYMVESRPLYTIDQARFSIDSLVMIYKQLRERQEDANLIDTQTFQNIMLLNMQ